MPESVTSDNIASIPLSNLTQVFLPILESLRDLLARRLVRDCHTITDHDLNYAILLSILQVLFIRTGQDCGFVEPGTLALLAESDNINRRMARACSDTGLSPDILFEKGPDGSRSTPVVPDDALREVIRCMDSEKFPVPISTVPIEHLAVVFEHFMGTRMHIAEGYRVKRAGKSALLYTGSVDIPLQVLVDYMVNKTMSDAIRKQETRGGTGIRIVDPACGAGIFLLAAYRILVRGKTGYPYRPEQGQELLHDLAWQSIYGTDIDPEYVSSARFILLLSFIEECRLSGNGHVSPDRLQVICKCLKRTIRCGNALISKDYFSGLQEHPFNGDERRKVNAFSWQEAFPHILESGGFDVVIGAPPPYQPFTVKARDEYFQMHYDVYAKDAGLYGYFIEMGLKILRSKGSLAFCIPGTFLRTNHARSLRKFLLTKQIEEIIDFGDLPVFNTRPTYPCIIRISNNKPAKEFYVSKVKTLDFKNFNGYVKEHRHPMDQHTLTDGGWTLIDKRIENLLKKLQSIGTPLEEYVMGGIYRGVITGLDKAFVIDEDVRKKLIKEDPHSIEIIKPYVAGRDIKRYQPLPDERFLIFTRRGIDIKNYPAIEKYLKQFKPQLSPKPDDWDGNAREGRKPGPYKWYEIQDVVDFYPEFEKPKIIFVKFQMKIAFTFDSGMHYPNGAIFIIPKKDFYLLGLLNSKLGWFLISNYCTKIQAGYQLIFQDLGRIPIYTIDFDNPDDKTRHDRMVTLVTEMLELHKHLSHAKTDREKRIITQDIGSMDRQIDSLVYGLYGLTADEIAVVEETLPR